MRHQPAWLCSLPSLAASQQGFIVQAPGFATTCNACGMEIDVGTGMRCTQCTDFDLCNTCGKGPPGQQHPHRLVVRNPPMASCLRRLVICMRVVFPVLV